MIYTLTLNPAIDYVMEPLTLDMGFTNRSSSEEIHCGGNGINVSTILNELDCDNVALGIIGGFTGTYLLETLIDRKTRVLATTHYTELKKFAVTKEGVGNASMQFDVETLSPTYKLIMGTPGKSNAFEISRKLGVAPAVVDRAQELVSEGVNAKLSHISPASRTKLCDTMSKIINEGSGGLICIIL